ncbi:hypothetical protein PF005_g17223 [Phytophthora fragariae]|uniref:Uncharacterized protein n=2 Tax=Phytophthora TaxID=4783 RepID=A0A6A3Y1H5_9STRA|nr:hypothetical protein PF003_g30661 [Phytophthora fragariae]KAE9016952.1 hypothetical protein PR002_g13531 [Phytophthora rubi]KAE8931527.1 hypothetical protein PF009_g18421 [Phytophthora fragariae]KAE8995910.1 hypothetical protein PF011_g16130 [Phytophthora fragariae]KAE9022276.1 hypothetical protein PR001_g13183 [Phytophthora rubi]
MDDGKGRLPPLPLSFLLYVLSFHACFLSAAAAGSCSMGAGGASPPRRSSGRGPCRPNHVRNPSPSCI